MLARNAWYSLDTPTRSRPNLPLPETEGVYGTDPQFQDVEKENSSSGRKVPSLGSECGPSRRRSKRVTLENRVQRLKALRTPQARHDKRPPLRSR